MSEKNVELMECECCGQLVNKDELVTVHMADGSEEQWCLECTDNHAIKCDHCGEWHEDGDIGTVIDECGDEEYWCESCIDNDAYWCERCERWTEVTNDVHVTRRVRGSYGWYMDLVTESWCHECTDDHASECDDCGDLIADVDAINETDWNGDGLTLCPSCYDDRYVRCTRCERLVHEDDAYYDEDDYEYYCPDCHEEHRHNDALHRYGRTHASVFWFDDGHARHAWDMDVSDRKKLFIGIELETDDNDDAEDLASDIAGVYDEDYVECKRDGSLHCEGVEIVSQPMTPNYHLTSEMWERIASIVRSHGGTSHDAGTCGLHMHVSRSYFTDHDAVYRLDRLFHRFEHQLVRFSRRSSDGMRWCHLSEYDELASIPNVSDRKEKWEKDKSRAGRYEAINDTCGATVEFRLWRGTLNIETLYATIQMTAGLAIVANGITDELADSLGWDSVKLLVRFCLEEQGIRHDELDAYLTRRGL